MLLAAAVALYVAVRLVEAVWIALVAIGGVGLLLAVVMVVLRRRHDGW